MRNNFDKGDGEMKTKEELNALKEEVETLNKKLHELTDEELAQVAGGVLLYEPADGAETSRGKDTGKDSGKTEDKKNTGENTSETHKPI